MLAGVEPAVRHEPVERGPLDEARPRLTRPDALAPKTHGCSVAKVSAHVTHGCTGDKALNFDSRASLSEQCRAGRSDSTFVFRVNIDQRIFILY